MVTDVPPKGHGRTGERARMTDGMNDLAYMAGVFNITPTPFHPDGSLDLPSVATLTRFLIDRGVHA